MNNPVRTFLERSIDVSYETIPRGPSGCIRNDTRYDAWKDSNGLSLRATADNLTGHCETTIELTRSSGVGDREVDHVRYSQHIDKGRILNFEGQVSGLTTLQLGRVAFHLLRGRSGLLAVRHAQLQTA